MKVQVVVIDKNHKTHVAETLTQAEYLAEGAAGCATLARTFCIEHGLGFRDWRAEKVAANSGAAAATA